MGTKSMIDANFQIYCMTHLGIKLRPPVWIANILTIAAILNLVVLQLMLSVVENNEDVLNFFDLKFRTVAELVKAMASIQLHLPSLIGMELRS